MTNSPQRCAVVQPELWDKARAASGLPDTATSSEVIRYALAALAGEPDPLKASGMLIGHPHVRRVGPELLDRARRDYLASVATGKPLSRAKLADKAGITQGRARGIIERCKREHQAAA